MFEYDELEFQRRWAGTAAAVAGEGECAGVSQALQPLENWLQQLLLPSCCGLQLGALPAPPPNLPAPPGPRTSSKNPRDHMVNVWGYSHLNFFAPMSRFGSGARASESTGAVSVG